MSELRDVADQIRRQLQAEPRLPRCHLFPDGEAICGGRWWAVRLEGEEVARASFQLPRGIPARLLHERIRDYLRKRAIEIANERNRLFPPDMVRQFKRGPWPR